MNLKRICMSLSCILVLSLFGIECFSERYQATENLIIKEVDGIVASEAEYFYKQTHTESRMWYLISPTHQSSGLRDPDPAHLQGASNNAYLEILPDTRTNHDEKLIVGENFINEPGKMAVLYYKVNINEPGRYYVWVRTHSTNTEDNGLHVGIDGTWPEHGQRMQWTTKDKWFWNNKQRTEEVHTGVPMEIYLDIDEPGDHEIMFSMREDGFEFDKWMLVKDKNYRPKQDTGPIAVAHRGDLPSPFPALGNESSQAQISGELKKWHKVTLTFEGPETSELAVENPFLNYRLDVTFSNGNRSYTVPGFYAADGNTAETSGDSGNKWMVRFSPDRVGNWTYEVSFKKGNNIAVADDATAGESAKFMDGQTGQFSIEASDKAGIDNRAKGRLNYIGEHYLRFEETGKYFIKVGVDAPENLFAYNDFDATPNVFDLQKSWQPHQKDYTEAGQPFLWQSPLGVPG